MKKIVVWGKFDGLHDGHLEFLRKAKELGDELYVIIIPDEKVKENSGKNPGRTLEVRKRELLGLDIVADIYIDCLDDGLKSVLDLRPDFFVFGYDQKTKWEERLQEHLSSNGIFPKYVCLGVYSEGVHARDIGGRV